MTAATACDAGPVRPGLDGARADGGCVAPLAICGSQCLDLSSDPRHCGGCDQRCAAGSFCADGRCQVTCAAGLTACDEACVDLDASRAHCGACDAACEGELTCEGGACGCVATLTQCGDRCVDLDASLEHCGACDNACGPHGYDCDGGCVLDGRARFDLVIVNAEIPETNVGGADWDSGSGPDVYVNARVGAQMQMAPVQTSRTVFNDPAPVFDDALVTSTTADSFLTYLRLDLYESDAGDDTLIGACRVTLSDASFDGSLRRVTCNPTATTAGWVVRLRFVAP